MALGGFNLKARASEYANRVIELAKEAAQKDGTFGVGAILLDSQGNTLYEAKNRVIVEGFPQDPTAHAERQIITWYQKQIQNGAQLPPPEELTIVSSLDPCVGCAGCIAQTGMNVISIGLDDYVGINSASAGQYSDFASVPRVLQNTIQDRFAYFGQTGEGGRPYFGSKNHPFAGTSLSVEIHERNNAAFFTSLQHVRDSINTTALPCNEMDNLTTLPSDHPVIVALKAVSPGALSVKIPAEEVNDNICDALLAAAEQGYTQGGRFDAAALLDQNGNLLMVRGGNAVTTPMRQMIQEYAQLRYDLYKDSAIEEVALQLPHPKSCKVVKLQGPDISAYSLEELGYFGSALEGPMYDNMDQHFEFVIPKMESEALSAMLDNLPPYYSAVIRIAPVQISDQNLAHKIKTLVAQKVLKLLPAPEEI